MHTNFQSGGTIQFFIFLRKRNASNLLVSNFFSRMFCMQRVRKEACRNIFFSKLRLPVTKIAVFLKTSSLFGQSDQF
uniref:Uncharacterized protein n=1 Tax=Anguilla anguilla TaxID=7936 RepID=A0A0E9SW46_ANGAN